MAGRKLDDLIIGLQLTTKSLEQGMNEVKKKLNQHSSEVKKASKNYDELAVAAGYAFYKIVAAVNSGIKAYNDYRNSMVGLTSVVNGTGNSFGEAQKFINEFVSDGLVPANNAAKSLQYLLAHGFSMQQATDAMKRFKDAAVFNRQESYTIGEAIQKTAEGFKLGLSTLTDAAGMTENLSVMWKDYAQALGKGEDSLTAAEKVQAEYAGIMKYTSLQIGNAAKYSEEFGGAQARATAETLKLKQAFGGALVPILNTVYTLITPIIGAVATFIQQNPVLSGSIIAMVATLAALATGILAVTSAFQALKPAIVAVTAVMATNPIILAITIGLTALVGIIAVVTANVQNAKKAQKEYNDALIEHDRIIREGITKTDIPAMQEKVDKLKKLSSEYDAINAKIKALQGNASGLDKVLNFSVPFYGVLTDNASRNISLYSDQLDEIVKKMKAMGATQETVNQIIKDYETAIKEANRTTFDELNTMARDIAQKKVSVVETQNLIKAYKSAEKGTKDWYEARDKLAEQFPQFASASGIEIKSIEAVTTAQETAIKAEWDMMKVKIAMTKIDLMNIISVKTAALESLQTQQRLNDFLTEGITGKKVIRPPMLMDDVGKARAELFALRQELGNLDAFSGLDIDKILGVKPLSGNPFTSYTNAALDSALKIHDHKVHMSQLSAEAEIKDLETIQRKYAKTADEKMDMEERIFDAKEALRKKNQDAIEKSIKDEEDTLARRTQKSYDWISAQKLTGTFSSMDEISAYNRMIKYHKDYLNKVLADTKTTQEEKTRIQDEEIKTIRDLESKIYDIRKSYTEKAISEYIQAQKNKYDTEETLENERLNKKLRDLEKEYSDKEKALRDSERATELSTLYEQEKKYANAATKEGQDKLKSIRDDIAKLQKEAEQERLDAEKESKKAAIEDEIKANQDKYKQLRADLEVSQREMLAAATKYAADANAELTKGANDIAGSLQNVMKQFDIDSTNLVKKGMEKLKQLVDEYRKIMDSISMNPLTAPSAGGKAAVAASQKNVSVTVNDYGNKIISAKDEAVDYTKELFNAGFNAARTAGANM